MRFLLVFLMMCLGALPALAHGDKEHDDDDAEAIDVSGVDIPENPTYHEHARPIIEASCVGCHSDGQIAGYAPFTSARDVISAALDIEYHVVKRIMPPWMPSRDNYPLKYNRSLSDMEIATIAAWVAEGAALGDPHDYAPAEMGEEPPHIRADMVLRHAEPYLPAAGILDDYRCFAFPLELEAPQFVTGYEFIPDAVEMAHHSVIYLVGAAMKSEIEARDYEDGRPGWSCYGETGLSDSGEIIAGWTPGSSAAELPDGTGYYIEPGQYLVHQMHYNLAVARKPDRSSMILELAPGDRDIAKLMTWQFVAPVEIPCPAGVTGPQCEREYALDRIAAYYGEEQRYWPDGILAYCGQTLSDYAGNTGERAHSTCDFVSPYPVTFTFYSVYGHMHELGTRFTMELNPEGENPLLLLDIPRWDFDWQDSYEFVEPIELNYGDTLRMSCWWDNSKSDEPRYVVWGEGTTDEMCYGTMTGREG